MPPQLAFTPMQALMMWPGFVQLQVLPLAEISLPLPQLPVTNVRPPHDHEPDVVVLSALAMAWTVEGTVQETPVVSNVPERVIDVSPLEGSVALQEFQTAHGPVAMTPEVKTSENV